MNTFTFVDLAGSERAKKTLNVGQRLVESNSINKSLSVLGKCLTAMKNNQSSSKNKMVVPVRDSKITKLMKNALLGQHSLTFIINISMEPQLFDETLHVLKFSALAAEIVPEPKTRFSKLFSRQLSSALASSCSDLSDALHDPYINQLNQKLATAEQRVQELEEIEKELQCKIREIKLENDHFWEKLCDLEDSLAQVQNERDCYQEKVHELSRQAKAIRIKATQQSYDSMVSMRDHHKYETYFYKHVLDTHKNPFIK